MLSTALVARGSVTGATGPPPPGLGGGWIPLAVLGVIIAFLVLIVVLQATDPNRRDAFRVAPSPEPRPAPDGRSAEEADGLAAAQELDRQDADPADVDGESSPGGAEDPSASDAPPTNEERPVGRDADQQR